MLALFFFLFLEGLTESNEITLVTAFFDVNVTGSLTDASIEHFKGWARIKNDLVVFCQNEAIKNEIVLIRNNFGLADNTKVILINDIRSIKKETFERMVKISKERYFLKVMTGTVEHSLNPDYVYLQSMKPYFLDKATLELNIRTENVAWIDFDFNHSPKQYAFEEDFSFKLECGLSNKITLFRVEKDTGGKPLFEIMRDAHNAVIAANFIVCPRNLTSAFLDAFNDKIRVLLDLGLMLDDKAVHLYLSGRRKDLFEVKSVTDWFMAPNTHCNGKMRLTS